MKTSQYALKKSGEPRKPARETPDADGRHELITLFLVTLVMFVWLYI